MKIRSFVIGGRIQLPIRDGSPIGVIDSTLFTVFKDNRGEFGFQERKIDGDLKIEHGTTPGFMTLEETEKFICDNYSPPRKIRPPEGFVYVLSVGNGMYKIGKTKNLISRMKWFKIVLPFKIEQVHVYLVNDMNQEERTLHQQFSLKNVNGEWFKLELDDIDWIYRRYGAEQTFVRGIPW